MTHFSKSDIKLWVAYVCFAVIIAKVKGLI